jgi:hypothetical protein
MLDFLRALVGDTLSFVAYAALFAGVYKLFQVSTALDEIKELLKEQRRSEFLTHGPAAVAGVSPEPLSDEAAAEYAKNLLRAVNEEAQHAEAELHGADLAGTGHATTSPSN